MKFSIKRECAWGKEVKTKKQGWYLQSKYKINSVMDLICRYDSYDQDRIVEGDGSDIAILGIHYYAKHFKLQINYEHRIMELGGDINGLLRQMQIIF